MSHRLQRTGDFLVTSTNENSTIGKKGKAPTQTQDPNGAFIYHPKRTTDSKGRILKVHGCKDKLPSVFEECHLESDTVVDVVKNSLFQQEDVTYGKRPGRLVVSGELSQRSLEKQVLPTPPAEEAEEEKFSELDKRVDNRDLELFKHFKVSDKQKKHRVCFVVSDLEKRMT